jgi:hypothetical protein
VTPCCLVDSEQCSGDISFLLLTSKTLHPAICNLDTPGLTLLALYLYHEDQPVNLIVGNNHRLLHLTKHTITLRGNAFFCANGIQSYHRTPEGYTCLSDMPFPRPRTHALGSGALMTLPFCCCLLTHKTHSYFLTHVLIFFKGQWAA